MESLHGIGRMSRESGLSVSALRFYDGAGVLSPLHVDPRSSYRYYAPDQLVVARLVATLRRVGMPLAGIRAVLACRHDAAAVDELVGAHLRRLEQGLADARRELSSIRTLLDQEETTMPPTTVTVGGADLTEALGAVRFAVGADPDLPVLGGVLFDVSAEAVTLVTTDRYRLAASPVAGCAVAGPPVAAVVPADLADAIPSDGPVVLTVAGSVLTVRAGERVVEGPLLADAFPDYRRLLAEGGRTVPVDAALRTALVHGPTRTVRRDQDGAEFEAAVLSIGADGGLAVGADGAGIGVNREFLLQALDAGGEGQLVLALDGPVAPLVIRSPRSVSLLMPVRL